MKRIGEMKFEIIMALFFVCIWLTIEFKRGVFLILGSLLGLSMWYMNKRQYNRYQRLYNPK